MSKEILHCSNCGSSMLRWEYGVKNNSNIADGCLYMRNMVPIAYLGCEACSETIRVCSIEESIEIQLEWAGVTKREYKRCSRKYIDRGEDSL